MRHRLWSAVMYRTVPSLPQLQLDVLSPVLIVPRCSPLGLKTRTPPGPVAKRLPFLSTFMQSGSPFWPALANLLASKKTFPLPRVPSLFTGKAIQIAFSGSELATYRVFSSGENAIPLGLLISLVSSVSLPFLDSR